MKKKYIVKDEDKEIEVIEEELKDDDETVAEVTENEATGVLTNDEIVALKGLAAVADQLMKLLAVEKEEHAATETAGEELEEDSCDEDEDEEVIDTMKKDSLKSFGAIEKKKSHANDSIVEDEVSAAWAKRYGGNA